MALQLCPSCSRHVRDSEPHCPFCEAPRSSSHAGAPTAAPRSIPRLSRAAKMAFAATLVLGCREETKPTNDPTSAELSDAASVPPMETIAPPPGTTATAPPPPAHDAGLEHAKPHPDYNQAKPYGAPPADGLLT